jgi:shikimate kinase
MPDRPLFKSPEEVSKLLERRRAHYAKADYPVAVQRKSPVEIVREILDLLERKP